MTRSWALALGGTRTILISVTNFEKKKLCLLSNCLELDDLKNKKYMKKRKFC